MNMANKKIKGASSGDTEKNKSYFYAQRKRINVTKRDDLVAVRFHSRAPLKTVQAFDYECRNDLEPSDEFQKMQFQEIAMSLTWQNGTLKGSL
jgi:hypothetical protein